MESREEIESMRVIDLREFIRRNGSLPTVVTRTDGTPGAPRKADLMRAALDIEEAHRLGRPPSALAEEPALAPYTPPRRGTVSHLADDDGDDDDDIPNPFQSKSTPPKPKSRRSSFHTPSARAPAEPPSEQPHPAPSADRRKRRASAAWIDPSIFANLSSAKASTASAGEEEIPLPVPDEEPILVEDDDPPPPPPVIDRPAPRPRTPARRSAPRGSPAATDPNVISLGLLHEFAFPDEDDLDDDFDPADDVFVNDPLDDEDERDLDNLLAYNDPLLRTSALADDRRDILVQSDQESGHDSTRETDDELPSDDFSSWDVLKLRRWLKRHNVRYPRDSQKIDLVSLARAHLLHMETSSQAIPVEDDIRPVPKTKSERRKPRLTRRNRTISAPVEDDDDRAEPPIDVDAVPSTQANTVHRSRRGRTKSSTKRPVYPRRRLLLSTRVCVLLLGLLLGTSCLWSAYTVYQSHMRPFCDTGALLTRNRYGQECRHCPTNGTCVDGKLSCEAGFVVVGGKVCVEDQESSVFGEELANEANKILSHVAGDAECRGIESRFLSRSDLREILRPEYSKTSTGGLFFWGARKFDPAKFDVSFDKAIRRLEGEGFPDVHISQSGFSSNSPVMSLRCTAKLALRRNWRVVAAFIAACLLLLCLKIWLYIRRRQKEELEGAFGLALGYLREQKTGFVHREEELAFISDVVLRQEVLGSPTEKTVRLWKKVEAMLRNDSRVAWSANRVVKGVPSNTFEWRGRLAKGSVYSSGGSLRSLDSPGLSEGEGRTPAIESWIEEARRRLFTRY